VSTGTLDTFHNSGYRVSQRHWKQSSGLVEMEVRLGHKIGETREKNIPWKLELSVLNFYPVLTVILTLSMSFTRSMRAMNCRWETETKHHIKS